MFNFIIYGIIAIIFLIVGFFVGKNGNKKNNTLDYIPSCLNCTHLKYHSPEIDNHEKYHYSCNRYGQFNLAPDVCGSHELNTKYVERIIQCKNCKHFHTTPKNQTYCAMSTRYCNFNDYCAWGELNE